MGRLFKIEQSTNWIVETETDETDVLVIYTTSLTFIIMTITSVGYGSNAYTSWEYIAVMVLQIIGTVAYASLAGILTNTIANLDEQRAELENKLEILNDMSKELDMPLTLYTEIKQNLEYSSKN